MDTCLTARKLRRVLNDHIKRVAEEEVGFPAKRIKVFTADCWQHLRNDWFGAVTAALEGELLREVLANDLKDLPDTFQIKLDIDNFFRCMEKEFGDNVNYAKGHGAEFRQWKKEYHLGGPAQKVPNFQMGCMGIKVTRIVAITHLMVLLKFG
jgi:hypothetical protein